MLRGRRRPAPGGASRGQPVLSKFFSPKGTLKTTTACSSEQPEERSEEEWTAASAAAENTVRAWREGRERRERGRPAGRPAGGLFSDPVPFH